MTFLTKEEVARLTGRKTRHLQAAQLRQMGIPFRVNAVGEPVVTVAAVVGNQQLEDVAWVPALASR